MNELIIMIIYGVIGWICMISIPISVVHGTVLTTIALAIGGIICFHKIVKTYLSLPFEPIEKVAG